MSKETIIKLVELSKSFYHNAGNHQVLKQINFQLNSAEMVAILGQSGSGKSTLLSILGLLDVADSGSYYLCQQDVRQLSSYQLSQLRNRHVGWVFQNFNLIADMTVAENLKVPLRFNSEIEASEYDARITDVLDKVGLSDRHDFYPDQLSGGQQQRVAIARALICAPDILLCDEPTGNLDSSNSRNIMDLLCQLHKEGRTVLIITHDNSVAACCQKAYKMTDGRLELMAEQEFKHAI